MLFGTRLVIKVLRSITQNFITMKAHKTILIMVLALVSIANATQAKKKKDKKREVADTQEVSMNLEMADALTMDDCISCPVNVKVFDKNFNLVMTGEMSPMQEASDQRLRILLNNSNFLMESGEAMIYQLEE